jgi:hypothetical protein
LRTRDFSLAEACLEALSPEVDRNNFGVARGGDNGYITCELYNKGRPCSIMRYSTPKFTILPMAKKMHRGSKWRIKVFGNFTMECK